MALSNSRGSVWSPRFAHRDYRTNLSFTYTPCAAQIGALCSTNIDDCAGVTCSSNGSCEDQIAAFICKCNQGWGGSLCETPIVATTDSTTRPSTSMTVPSTSRGLGTSAGTDPTSPDTSSSTPVSTPASASLSAAASRTSTQPTSGVVESSVTAKNSTTRSTDTTTGISILTPPGYIGRNGIDPADGTTTTPEDAGASGAGSDDDSGSSSWWWILLIVLLLLAIAAVTAALYRSRRRSAIETDPVSRQAHVNPVYAAPKVERAGEGDPIAGAPIRSISIDPSTGVATVPGAADLLYSVPVDLGSAATTSSTDEYLSVVDTEAGDIVNYLGYGSASNVVNQGVNNPMYAATATGGQIYSVPMDEINPVYT